MKDMKQLVEFIRNNTPAKFLTVCGLLKSLTVELESTKIELAKMLFAAENQERFSWAHDILNAQEALTQTICEYKAFLHEIGIEVVDQESKKEDEIPQKKEKDSDALAPMNLENFPVENDISTEVINVGNVGVTLIKRKPVGFSFNESFYRVRAWKEVLLKICEILYYQYPDVFHGFIDNTELSGRKNVFSSVKDDSRQPKKIENTDFWIHTKLGAEEIRDIILKLFERCNIQENTMKLYLIKK